MIESYIRNEENVSVHTYRNNGVYHSYSIGVRRDSKIWVTEDNGKCGILERTLSGTGLQAFLHPWWKWNLDFWQILHICRY